MLSTFLPNTISQSQSNNNPNPKLTINGKDKAVDKYPIIILIIPTKKA